MSALSRGLAAAEGLGELEHTVVVAVGDIEVARAVDGNAAGLAQTVRANAIYVAARDTGVAGEAEEVRLPDNQRGRRAIHKSARASPSEHPAVGSIGNIQMPVRIDRQTGG